MFEILPLKDKADYLKELDQRPTKGVYFTRFVGFNEEQELLVFLKKIHTATQLKGIFLNHPISNPTEREVNQFYEIVKSTYSYDFDHILLDLRRWLAGISLNKAQLLAEAIQQLLHFLKGQGVTANVFKNAYVKFLCWCRNVFSGVVYSLGEAQPPKILYQGPITKYEVYMLHILARAGCDVVYLSFTSDESYQKVDPGSKLSGVVYGKYRQNPQNDFLKIDLGFYEELASFKTKITNCNEIVSTNTWLGEDFTTSPFEALVKSNSVRGNLDNKKIYNGFLRYMGVDDKGFYLNRLFQLKNQLAKGKKKFLLLTAKLPNPSMDEVAQVKTIRYSNKEELIYGLALQLQVTPDKVQNLLVQRALVLLLSLEAEESLTRLHNDGVHLCCWLKRYLSSLLKDYQLEQIPIVAYYGNCSNKEADLLCLFALCGLDVVVISPDKQGDQPFQKNPAAQKSCLIELPQSMQLLPFPTKETKVRMATVAYSAERALDQVLYQGTGLFRNRQFTRSKPVTIKTTYEEIYILWKEEAKFRPLFQAEEGRVVVPNIFAKISGVKDGDARQYFQGIQSLLTENALAIQQIPYLTSQTSNAIRPYVKGFLANGVIQPELIKKHPQYLYDYLSADTQDYMLEKIQELLDLDWLEGSAQDLPLTILATLLNLETRFLRLIQNFDFTKAIPKIVIIDVNEAMFSLEDCILFSYLNLIGFDIVVFTPTGYRNLEKYMKPDAYEHYTIGEFMFNLTIPDLSPAKRQALNRSTNQNEGFFNRLFNRPKN